MPLVTASEGGEEQTELLQKCSRMWSCRTWAFPNLLTRSELESSVSESDNLVEEGEKENAKYPEYCSLDME